MDDVNFSKDNNPSFDVTEIEKKIDNFLKKNKLIFK